MAEQDKNAIREIPKHDIHVDASTKERSLFKDLAKEAMKEVIVPKSRDAMRNMSDDIFGMILEVLRNMRDSFLYPDGNVPYKKTSDTGVYTYTGKTNYTSFSTPINTYQASTTVASTSIGRNTIGQRPGNEVKYIWVESEDKAKQITETLKGDINHYGFVKVASLYEMIGEHTTMADFKYGWTKNELSYIRYYFDTNRRSDEFKWFIDLPRPVAILNN